MLFFRAANIGSTSRIYFYLCLPHIIFYKFFVQWLFMVEIPWNTKIGKGLVVYHCLALVINKDVVIGDYCVLRHTTTIGTKLTRDGTMSAAPKLGNHVDVGSNACIIGDISIGDNAKIGAGSVVIRDVSANCIAVGNPAVEKRYPE